MGHPAPAAERESVTDKIVARIEGRTGRISLNRPKALHALDLDMVRGMTEALRNWQHDQAVKLILIDHHEGRGFCAGGDVVTIAKSAEGHGAAGQAFFFQEYRMNHLMYTYPKRGVVFMDGIVMGGGVGISCPCKYRIATERTLFAMPEADIGLFPDVGAGWYLAHLPGETGLWMALTGARLKAADCVALGIATHFVESGKVEAFKAILAEGAALEAALADHGSSPGPAPVDAIRADIDRHFAHDTVEEIVASLEADGSDWAQAQLAAIARKCPTTHKVSLRQIRAGKLRATFADEMAVEYRLAVRMVHRHDFIEGVRALILDKDNAPRWEPPTLEAVTEEMIDALFDELPSDEEWTPLP